MKEIELASWEEFEQALDSFFESQDQLKKAKAPLYVSTPVFRGQANATWDLEDTLIRATKSDCSVPDYFRIMQAVRPAVISITEKEWELPDHFDLTSDDPTISAPQGYEFMVYLRHHGFPSPLLDWTRSPYVAAYFAFRSNNDKSDSKVAIYSYVEYLGEAKGWSGSEPNIHGVGPYVVSHKRHYAQQCEYTICAKTTNGLPVYTSHKSAVAKNDSGQDLLIKYVLPGSERTKALRRLELMNITAFSLFGSEESLMETLAYKEIEKRLLAK